jgi:amidase
MMAITRRRFVGGGLATGAAAMGGAFLPLPRLMAAPPQQPSFLEATIPQLQALMNNGRLTSRELTGAYLNRMAALNPLLGAVIETNPNAIAIAVQRDRERRNGHLRGPLHGIPVLVKDNIATADNMQTTAGSLALVNSQVPADAPIVSRLRAAGAVILGKTNLSEWANFRGFAPFNGWSGRGGFTRNPYLLDFDPCGSSSGSAVAPAANLCAASVGTETDGSIVCPSGNNLVVGLKPSMGLLSQDGIIPIGHSQDTAGPMTRTVTDAAIMLGVMQTPFGAAAGQPLPQDYTVFLQRGALKGARIGVDERYFTPDYGGEPDLIAVAQQGMAAMTALGATLVPTDSGDPFEYFDAEFAVLLNEFKAQIAGYLETLGHTQLRTLSDLISFNQRHCTTEMKYFGQELFEMSEEMSGDLTDPDYLDARAFSQVSAGANGIDAAIARDKLDAIIAPSYSFASSPAAVAGYPNISVPVGLTPEGKPAGIWMYSGFLKEPRLLALAYDLEQAIHPRRQPEMLGEVPPEPENAGICEGLPRPQIGGKAHMTHHLGTGKPFKR